MATRKQRTLSFRANYLEVVQGREILLCLCNAYRDIEGGKARRDGNAYGDIGCRLKDHVGRHPRLLDQIAKARELGFVNSGASDID